MIILATGTVFKKLINLGIDVDYFIVSDANDRIYAQVKGVENLKVPLIFLSTANRAIAASYSGARYLVCQNEFDVSENFANSNEYLLFDTGGSVSTTALDVAIRLRSKEIIFIGLDLAYTDNYAHTLNTSRRVAAEADECKKVQDVHGGLVPTSATFIIYKKWIEERIKRKDVTMKIINATEGGALINGLTNSTLKDILEIHY